MRKFAKAMVPLLAVVSTACFAQSEVTIYGRVDLGYVKDVGSSVKTLRDGATSMLGFRGAEDLGGGLSVFFDLDHRFIARWLTRCDGHGWGIGRFRFNRLWPIKKEPGQK